MAKYVFHFQELRILLRRVSSGVGKHLPNSRLCKWVVSMFLILMQILKKGKSSISLMFSLTHYNRKAHQNVNKDKNIIARSNEYSKKVTCDLLRLRRYQQVSRWMLQTTFCFNFTEVIQGDQMHLLPLFFVLHSEADCQMIRISSIYLGNVNIYKDSIMFKSHQFTSIFSTETVLMSPPWCFRWQGTTRTKTTAMRYSQ